MPCSRSKASVSSIMASMIGKYSGRNCASRSHISASDNARKVLPMKSHSELVRRMDSNCLDFKTRSRQSQTWPAANSRAKGEFERGEKLVDFAVENKTWIDGIQTTTATEILTIEIASRIQMTLCSLCITKHKTELAKERSKEVLAHCRIGSVDGIDSFGVT